MSLSAHARTHEHLAAVNRTLQQVTACSQTITCSPGWSRIEDAWRADYLANERERLREFHRRYAQFMPDSTLAVERFGALRSSSARRHLLKPSLFNYWEATFSCPWESRVPATLGDGPKWVCAPRAHRTPCRIASIGSNFDATFEEGMYRAAGCVSYIVDPTLSPAYVGPFQTLEGQKALPGFSRRISRFAHLNTSVGLGAEGGFMPNTSIPLVGLGALLCDHFGQQLPLRLSVLKLDVEAYEFDVLPGLWRLCETGQLVLDQLNIEMHLVVREQERPLLVRDVFSAFAGALRCGLVLHHKEVNTYTLDGNYVGRLAELSFVSLAHAKRAAQAVATAHGPFTYVGRGSAADLPIRGY